MHYPGCFSFFYLLWKTLFSKMYQYWEKQRLSAQGYDFHWGTFKGLTLRLDYSVMHRPKSILICFLTFARPPKTADHTTTNSRHRQNYVLWFYYTGVLLLVLEILSQRVHVEMTLDPSYLEDWHTKAGTKLYKTPGYSKCRQGLSLPTLQDLASLRMGCSLWGPLVSRTQFWVQAPWMLFERLVLGTTAAT